MTLRARTSEIQISRAALVESIRLRSIIGRCSCRSENGDRSSVMGRGQSTWNEATMPVRQSLRAAVLFLIGTHRGRSTAFRNLCSAFSCFNPGTRHDERAVIRTGVGRLCWCRIAHRGQPARGLSTDRLSDDRWPTRAGHWRAWNSLCRAETGCKAGRFCAVHDDCRAREFCAMRERRTAAQSTEPLARAITFTGTSGNDVAHNRSRMLL